MHDLVASVVSSVTSRTQQHSVLCQYVLTLDNVNNNNNNNNNNIRTGDLLVRRCRPVMLQSLF